MSDDIDIYEANAQGIEQLKTSLAAEKERSSYYRGCLEGALITIISLSEENSYAQLHAIKMLAEVREPIVK
jgi:hypothetical protein